MADAQTPAAKWQYWHDQLETAGKAKGFENWQTRARKIIRRYRDERAVDGSSDGMAAEVVTGSKFNILWSNVQTLMPALFAKQPKPVVERRYLDRDDVGRTASVILERALLYELDNGTYQSSLRKAVLDRLLPGRGVVWVRYEPKFMPTDKPAATQGTVAAAAPEGKTDPKATGDQALGTPSDDTTAGEEVASESVPVDYVDWKDFTTSPARTWEEVWWIDRLVYMTKAQGTKRFGDKFKDVPLDWAPNKETKTAGGAVSASLDDKEDNRAKVHETWDMSTRKVAWWADGYKDAVLDEKDDPLQLEGFWPVPKPLFATLTNDTLIPVPDYTEYQDQALELDDLTNRITNLVAAIKIAGLYDAKYPELQRIFSDGKENELVGVENMREFTTDAGANGMGAIWLVPLDQMVAALKELYIAREQVKQSLYEITGISDIVRGAAATGGAKTATEQRIKGQFASMRLNDMQAEVARFARDTLRIMGEIIAEHFDPMTLFLVSGYEQYAKEQFPPEPPAPQPMGQPAPMMGHNGGPPMVPGAGMPPPPPGAAAPGMGQVPPPGGAPGMMMPPPDPMMVAQQKAAAMFKQAVALLKNDKLRGFRIDIETDSLIEADQQATQESRTQLLSAISKFLPEAIEAGAQVPELKPLMARLLMFFLRGFKASRDIESAFEQFIDDVTKDAASPKPKPPSPEEIAQQTEMQKQQADAAQQARQAQIDQQNLQAQQALDQQNFQLRMQEAQQVEQFAAAQHQRDMEMLQAKAALETRNHAIGAIANEHEAMLEADAREHAHGLTMEATEAAAAAAKAKKQNGATA